MAAKSLYMLELYKLVSEQLQSYLDMTQGIIDPTGTETFAKERKFAKLLRELQSTPVRCH